MNKQPFYWDSWLRRREIGRPRHIGFEDKQCRNIYSSFRSAGSWSSNERINSPDYGGVFNLEFSPDGSILVAATEKRAILVFDPLNKKLTNSIDTGHSDCVNCARFLDCRTFATCSDDTTVALWDVRYLKKKVRTLKGHSNWVKNIEYCSNSGLLVTSGFDGSIYTWEINKYSESEVPYKRVFYTSGLMRTKMTPDSSKLIMSTTTGYMMIVHDLDLNTLAADLKGFKPNTFRLFQLGNGNIPIKFAHNHLFTAKRNRIEILSDFPTGNDAEMIASLQVHPQGWSVLSRNTSSQSLNEWTCIHDIQDYPLIKEIENEDDISHDDDDKTKQGNQNPAEPFVHISMSCINNSGAPQSTSSSSQTVNAPERTPPNDDTAEADSPSPSSSFRVGNVRVRISQQPNLHPADQQSDNLRPENNSVYFRENSSPLGGPHRNINSLSDNGVIDIYTRLATADVTRPAIFIRAGGDDVSRTFIVVRPQNITPGDLDDIRDASPSIPMVPDSDLGHSQECLKVPKNRKRLTHYIEEPNVGRGYIKELCFSSDGRLVCSPFGFGVRLLAFNPTFSEICDCVSNNPLRLYEASTTINHSKVVVCTKFSPTHNIIVSGCLGGKINFYQPVLS